MAIITGCIANFETFEVFFTFKIILSLSNSKIDLMLLPFHILFSKNSFRI